MLEPKIEYVMIRKSPVTGKMNEMSMSLYPEDYLDWKHNGVLIQDAMPYLTPDEREFLMTGCTPEDWDTMFLDSSGE